MKNTVYPIFLRGEVDLHCIRTSKIGGKYYVKMYAALSLTKDGEDPFQHTELLVPIPKEIHDLLEKGLDMSKSDSAHVIAKGKLEFTVSDANSPLH